MRNSGLDLSLTNLEFHSQDNSQNRTNPRNKKKGCGPSGTEDFCLESSVSAVLEVISNSFASTLVQHNYRAMLSTAEDPHSCKMRCSEKGRGLEMFKDLFLT